MSVLIVADVHEQKSGLPECLSDIGIEVEIHSLPTGDHVLGAGPRRQRPRFRDRPAYAQRPKREAGAPAAEAALACVPGVSTVLARVLLTRFGTLAAVVAADAAEWQQVAGIGPRKADALATTFHTPHAASCSPHRGERPDPST